MTRRRQKQRQQSLWDDSPGLFDIVGDDDAPELTTLSAPAANATRQPDRLRYMSFGSGSSGNCSYVGTPADGILIDAGVDVNYVLEQLTANGIDPLTVRGIILTHDHGDHVRYAYAILRRYRHMRLYATPKAFAGLLRRHSMSRRIKDYHSPIYKEFPFSLGSLTITPFETSHDGTDNSGFYIEGAGTTFVVATDTGTITARADFYIRQTRNLMIEANYDAAMLRNGHYPVHLKARISSTIGHLDNADAARYLAAVTPTADIRRIFLCHLSQDNNTPQIALATVRGALEAAGVEVLAGTDAPAADTRLHLSILPRTEATSLLTLV